MSRFAMPKTLLTAAAVLTTVLYAAPPVMAQHHHHNHHNQFHVPPSGQIYALTQQLESELRSFSIESHEHLAGTRHFDHLCSDIQELEEELCELKEAIREAAHRPDRWNRVARRASAVEKDVRTVKNEFALMLRDVRRPVVRTPEFHNQSSQFGQPTVYGRQPGFGIALQFGNGRPTVRVVPTSQVQRRYAAQPVVQPDPCDELRFHVSNMQSLASQLVALTQPWREWHCQATSRFMCSGYAIRVAVRFWISS
jgi:hypothetical protein